MIIYTRIYIGDASSVMRTAITDRTWNRNREEEFRENGYTTQEFDGETGTLETVDDEEEYADYLHSLQCMDAYYAIPLFYQSKTNADMPFGNYAITSETDTIFPVKPLVPPFVNDPKTGKPLECSLYAVSLYSYAKKKMLARVSFDDFCRMADIGNCEKHDRLHVILKVISDERLAEMAAEGCPDPLEGVWSKRMIMVMDKDFSHPNISA